MNWKSVTSGIGRFFDVLRTFVANALLVLFLLIVVGLFLAPAGVEVPERGALVLAPRGAIVEQLTQVDPLRRLLGSGGVTETRLRDLLRAVERATRDERLPLIVLDLDELTYASPSHLATLGRALDAAREAGKEVIATGKFFSQAQYLLASYADRVVMHPMGQVMLTGYGVYQTYYKEALEKLDVNMHVFRVGTYKAAVEPFLRNDMSPAAEMANRALVDSLWDQYVARIAGNREIEPASVNNYVERFPALLEKMGGNTGRLALESGLVDELMSGDATNEWLAGKVGAGDDGRYRRIGYADYLAAVDGDRAVEPGKPQVAVLTAQGIILMGRQPRGTVGVETFVPLIRQVRDDAAVKAVVLRVDSPGGSLFASELIREELELLQLSGKPLVTSMGPTAASGGYWIAATSDEIWAAPTTITGSIGVFGLLPTFEDSLAAIGVHRDGVGTSELAGGVGPLGGLSDAMASIIQTTVENGYQRFINLVARGRDMAPEAVDEIAQGRVWVGTKALELGLVDQLGDLEDAIAAAAARADLEDYTVRYVERPVSAGEMLLRQLTESMGSLDAPRPFAYVYQTLKRLKSLNDPSHVYGLCERCTISP